MSGHNRTHFFFYFASFILSYFAVAAVDLIISQTYIANNASCILQWTLNYYRLFITTTFSTLNQDILWIIIIITCYI